MKSDNWGGARKNAGRPRVDKNGEKRATRHITMTDTECEKVKQYLDALRAGGEINEREVMTGKALPAGVYGVNKDNRYKIESVGTKAHIYTPYNNTYIKRIRGCGAKWNQDGFWEIDEKKIDAAREIMRDVFYRDDRYIYDEMVTVKITIIQEFTGNYNTPVSLMGKDVARSSKDKEKVIAGDDAAIIKGSPFIGTAGRDRDYYITVREGTEFIIYNVPRKRFEKERIDNETIYDASIVEEEGYAEGLKKEREWHLIRLKEIAALLD